MKKLLLIASLAMSTFAQAQLIDRNDIILQAGVGIGIYHYQFTELSTGIRFDRDTSGAFVFPFSIEYGINRWLGASACYTFHNFIEGDSANNERAIVMDFGVAANFHVPWGLKKFDLTGNIGYGYSRFKYEFDEPGDPILTANGSVFFVGLNPRIYFSDENHLGISFWWRYAKYNYPKGILTNNSGNEIEYSLDSPTNGFGLGLFYKI